MCTEYHTVLCNPNTRRSKSWCGLVAEKGRIPMLLRLAELHTKSTSAMEITAWSFSVLQYKRVLDLNSQFYQFNGSSKCRIFISPNITSESWTLYVANTKIGILKSFFKAWTVSTTQSHSHLSPAHLWVSSSPLDAFCRATAEIKKSDSCRRLTMIDM